MMKNKAMQDEESHGVVSGLPIFSKLAAIAVILTCALVLIGWAFDIAVFKSILPDAVAMQPNAALAFILSSLSLRLWISKWNSLVLRTFIARSLGLFVFLIGGLTFLD